MILLLLGSWVHSRFGIEEVHITISYVLLVVLLANGLRLMKPNPTRLWAGLLSFLVLGLGHIYSGYTKLGIALVSIHCLFIIGGPLGLISPDQFMNINTTLVALAILHTSLFI